MGGGAPRVGSGRAPVGLGLGNPEPNISAVCLKTALVEVTGGLWVKLVTGGVVVVLVTGGLEVVLVSRCVVVLSEVGGGMVASESSSEGGEGEGGEMEGGVGGEERSSERKVPTISSSLSEGLPFCPSCRRMSSSQSNTSSQSDNSSGFLGQ